MAAARCVAEDLNRRPPKSLQNLSKEKIVTMALATMRRIQTGLKIAWLGWPFTCIPNFEPKAFRRQGIRQLQSYLTTAPHLFNSVVLEMYRRDPSCTEALIHPHLRTIEVNSKTLPLVLEYSYNLTNITTLYLFFDINRHVALVPQFHAFVGSLKNLTHLKLSNCCTDQLLAVIGANCKNLEVLDAEEDSEMMTTDHGLAFLANCQKLHTVILNDAGDEYDYEDRYFGITGKGVANLLIALPRLSLLMCEPYLLREAIKFVHTINVNALTYRLMYLHTRFPDRDFLTCATTLCPNIKELVIEDQGRDCAEALTRMSNLECLTLENYTWHVNDERFYQVCFSRLTRLVLKNPKMVGVDVEFLEKLGEWCCNLRSLSITLYHRDLFSRVHLFNGGRYTPKDYKFLPMLESLTIDGDVSLCLIESLLTSVKGLKSLTIYVHRQLSIGGAPAFQLQLPDDPEDEEDEDNFVPPIVGAGGGGAFDVMMLRMARDGHLSELVSLQCFQWDVSLETMLFIVDQCPKLRDIWGLDLVMLSPSAIAAVQSHIKKNNRHIDVHDGMCGSTSSPTCTIPKGIPFLSERSKHRVEAADNAADDDGRKLEKLLSGEEALEDILREVCLQRR